MRFFRLTTRTYPTEQVQSILQPEISTHSARFQFECKILKFPVQGIHEKKKKKKKKKILKKVSELTNL